MESREERPPHDPDDVRGGGGTGGGPGTDAQEKWKTSEESKKTEGGDESVEPESGTAPSSYEG